MKEPVVLPPACPTSLLCRRVRPVSPVGAAADQYPRNAPEVAALYRGKLLDNPTTPV